MFKKNSLFRYIGLLLFFMPQVGLHAELSFREVVYKKRGDKKPYCEIEYVIDLAGGVEVKMNYSDGRKKQLTIRSLELEDAPLIFEYAKRNKKFHKKFLPAFSKRYGSSIAKVRRDIRYMQKRSEEGTPMSCWVVESDGEMVAHLAFHSFNAHSKGSIEIAYSIDEQYSGRGLATVATKALILRSTYLQPELKRIQAAIEKNNDESLKLAKRLGMKRGDLKYKDWPYKQSPWEMAVYFYDRSNSPEEMSWVTYLDR